MAKLRVGWVVADWASGVPRIAISRRFQSITGCPDPRRSATVVGGGGSGVARAGTARPTATAAVARVTRTEVLRMAATPAVAARGSALGAPGEDRPAHAP